MNIKPMKSIFICIEQGKFSVLIWSLADKCFIFIKGEINNENVITDLEKSNDFHDFSHQDDDDTDDDYMDNVTLASLKEEKVNDLVNVIEAKGKTSKQEKTKRYKKKPSSEDSAEVEKVLKKSGWKVRDFVK